VIKVVAKLPLFTQVAKVQAIGQGSTVSLASRRYGLQFGINTLTVLNNCVTPLSNDEININK
jgi:hypothetical protein